MKLAIKFLLMLPLMLFGNIDEQSEKYSVRDLLVERNVVDLYMFEKAEMVYHQLAGASASGENQEVFFENLMSWWANKENQERLLQGLRDQAEKAGFSSSDAIIKMLNELQAEMEEFTEQYNSTHQPVAALK